MDEEKTINEKSKEETTASQTENIWGPIYDGTGKIVGISNGIHTLGLFSHFPKEY